MSALTSIEWTDRTWNPTRGCSRVSEGCRNCYAEKMAARFSKPGLAYHGFATVIAPRDGLDRVGGRRAGWTGKVELIPSMLDEPLRWRKPQRVFVNSMSDLFHESLSDETITRVFSVMGNPEADRHTFQILTKRPARMLDFIRKQQAVWERVGAGGPIENVWLGVSVEDQATADERIPLLLQTPAAVRFVSYEPALSSVDFTPYVRGWEAVPVHVCHGDEDACRRRCPEQEQEQREKLNWIIVGGESGPAARPFDVEWARSTVRQCKAAGVAVFVKQLGAQPFQGFLTAKETVEGGKGRPRPADQPLTEEAAVDILAADLALHVPIPRPLHLRDRKGGDTSEWPSDLRVREFPA